MAKKQARKLAEIKLTPAQKDVLAKGLESEFFEIISTVILPQRRIQLSLTAVEADQTMEELWYHRGMIYMCNWLPKYLTDETANVDPDSYNNEDEEVAAEDDQLS